MRTIVGYKDAAPDPEPNPALRTIRFRSVLTDVQVPAKAGVGVQASFSVLPRAWSAPTVGTPLWRFGDGKTATGAHVVHTFNATGIFTISVSQGDAAGNTSTASRRVTGGAG
jgi:PKD repeat protein